MDIPALFDHQIKLDNHLILTLEDMDLSNLLTRRTFTGLVVSDHQDALLFYEMCKKRNYTIPYDFSVVSLIDDYELPQTYPPISVIPVPHTECGRLALTSLVKIGENRKCGEWLRISSFRFYDLYQGSESMTSAFGVRHRNHGDWRIRLR